ncbi:hypothetical protein MMC17_001084 [Xylographa soralifera]|nr:hypothetical protein [Xylographa soralifera]
MTSPERKRTRRTRFVCISDTHNASPATGAFKLPRGDILIHAGDLTNQGTLSELQRTVDWIEQSDFEAKIVIAGNHDITLDSAFYFQHGLVFHNQHPQNSDECIRRLRDSPSITYLNHESKELKLTRPDGPRTSFKVFGSPYSPARGLWAFSYLPDEASLWWEKIPSDTDVVITHTPPRLHCDESRDRGAAGCEMLRRSLWHIRPQLAICGHVHEGRGVQRVQWDLTSPNVRYREIGTGYWTDPGAGKKQSYVDLSMRGGEPINGQTGLKNAVNDMQLDNGIEPRWGPSSQSKEEAHKSCSSPMNTTDRSGVGKSVFSWTTTQQPEAASTLYDGIGPERPLEMTGAESATHVQGGSLSSGQGNLELPTGRRRRRETCVINAAIMASSWPHKGSGGKSYNKPIVVDIDLPMWE